MPRKYFTKTCLQVGREKEQKRVTINVALFPVFTLSIEI